MDQFHSPSITLAAIALMAMAPINGYATDQENADATHLPAIHAVHSAPGPRIWQFRKGSSTLLVLGTIQPLRKSLSIDTRSVEAAISRSDAILSPPGVTVEHDGGVFRSLILWPAIRKLKFLSGRRTLRDELTEEEYTRLSDLKILYGLHDASIERMRPMYAAWKIHDAALQFSGARAGEPLSRAIDRMARDHGIPMINARFPMLVRGARETIQNFHIDSVKDRKCFSDATSSLRPWLDNLDELGHAWAEGDIESGALLHAPPSPSRCWARLTNDAIATTMNIDLDIQRRTHWVAVLRSTTSRHSTVFTTLPLDDLLHSRGMAAVLVDEGYIPDARVFFGDQPRPPNIGASETSNHPDG